MTEKNDEGQIRLEGGTPKPAIKEDKALLFADYKAMTDELNGLDKKLDQGLNKELSEKRDTLLIDRAKLLKLLWQERNIHLMATLDEIHGEGSYDQAILGIEEQIDASPVYATDIADASDERILRAPEEIQSEINFLLGRIESDPALLPDGMTADDVRAMADSHVAFTNDKKVFTRDGLNGTIDLLSDGYVQGKKVNERIIANPEAKFEQYLPELEQKDQDLARKLIAEGREDEALEILESLISGDRKQEYGAKLEAIEESEWRKENKLMSTLAETASVYKLERFSRDKNLPIEIEYLLSEEPSVVPAIEEMQKRGIDVRLQTIAETPDHILQAINRIAVICQENYISSWLVPFVREGKAPDLMPTVNGLKRAKESGLVNGEDNIDLQPDLDLIKKYLSEFKKFDVLNPEKMTEEDKLLVDRVNGVIAPLNTEYSVMRLLFDNAQERTGEAMEIVKKMMLVGPIAHALETVAPGMAKLFAASADDIGGEFGEIKALIGSGYSKSEVMKRLLVAAPVFILASAGALEVEELLSKGHVMEAGALFGLSAVALSLTTAIQSIAMYKKGYDTLIKEGKINGQISPLVNNPDFQSALKEYEKSESLFNAENRGQLIDLIRTHLKEIPNITDAEISSFMSLVEDGLNNGSLEKMIKSPSQFERFKEAIKQDFSNPARLGIFMGAAFAPVAGMAAAATGGLSNGFVMAGIGSTESVVAGLTVMMGDKLNQIKYRRIVEGKISSRESRSATEKAQIAQGLA
ncbi:MAG: hypothetical protein WC227_01685 [Patescibacteria group bacterium]|jgi:hypothetical protein